MIQYQILQHNITVIIDWAVRKITIDILEVKGLRGQVIVPLCTQGPVVQRSTIANPRILYSFVQKPFFGIIFFIHLRVSNIQILDKNKFTEFSFKAFRSITRFYINHE